MKIMIIFVKMYSAKLNLKDDVLHVISERCLLYQILKFLLIVLILNLMQLHISIYIRYNC